jgi:hypothetical protein
LGRAKTKQKSVCVAAATRSVSAGLFARARRHGVLAIEKVIISLFFVGGLTLSGAKLN